MPIITAFKHNSSTCCSNYTNGFSLIEVLIALFLFATGILGIAGLQMKSLSMLSDSDAINAAMVSASDMAARMRANQVGIQANAYDSITIPSTTKPTCTDSCSQEQLALLEAYEIYERMQTSLPQPSLTVVDVGDDIYTINISWEERVGLLSETKSHRISFRI